MPKVCSPRSCGLDGLAIPPITTSILHAAHGLVGRWDYDQHSESMPKVHCRLWFLERMLLFQSAVRTNTVERWVLSFLETATLTHR